MVVMNANHVLCAPSSKDFVIKIEWYANYVCQFSQEEGEPFIGFKDFSFFNTRSGVVGIFGKISLLNSSVGSGISKFSAVNMLLKGSFSAFALSLGGTAFVPLGLSCVGIAALVFNLDFAYFQNDLGYRFTLRARLFSKSLLAILVVSRNLFFSVNVTFSINIHFPQPCVFIL